MNLITRLKKAYNKISHNGGVSFSHSVLEDETFLNSFPEPQSDLDRSFFQYRCQKWNDSKISKYIISNIISFFLIIPFIIKYRINEKKHLYSGISKDVMTVDLRKRLSEIDNDSSPVYIGSDDGILTKEDLLWLGKIPIYKYGFFFFFKIMCKTAIYSKAIRIYRPNTIFCSAEYSFTSSMLTEYCENKGIEHVNIMHGEKIFDITNAFCRFSQFIIWDNFYKELFFRLRACDTNYIIEPKKTFILNECNNHHFTYYLQAETVDQLKKIKEVLDSLAIDYGVRPHPLYGKEVIFSVFEGTKVEDNRKISIEDSLNYTEYAISVDSTVLYEAYLAGRKVIIDDLSNPKLYTELKRRDYIMMQKKHYLLSEIVNNGLKILL